MEKPKPANTILELIERKNDAWRKSAKADITAIRLRKRGRAAEANRARERQTRFLREACELESKIIRSVAASPQEYKAKCRTLLKASFDPEDWIQIAWLLGHDAARLGLGNAMPERLREATAG